MVANRRDVHFKQVVHTVQEMMNSVLARNSVLRVRKGGGYERE